jgi:hypothetical protein
MTLPQPYKPSVKKHTLQEIAAQFVRDQIAIGVPREALDTTLAIVIHLKGLLAYYRDWRAYQANVPIDLSKAKECIDPVVWGKLSNQKKREFGLYIEKEAAASTRAVDGIITWLEAQLAHVEAGSEAFQKYYQEFETQYAGEELAQAA